MDHYQTDAKKRFELSKPDYNRPGHYRINRRESGHGESESMSPGNSARFPGNVFRGYTHGANAGKDFESNVGYRQHYDNLDSGDRYGSKDSGVVEGEWHQDERGLYKGKGPRSYQRKDERILEDINDRMCDNPYLDASDIEVSVANGEVTLAGSVDDRAARHLAEDIGESVSGVTNVVNRLRVTRRGI